MGNSDAHTFVRATRQHKRGVSVSHPLCHRARRSASAGDWEITEYRGGYPSYEHIVVGDCELMLKHMSGYDRYEEIAIIVAKHQVAIFITGDHRDYKDGIAIMVAIANRLG